MSSHEVASETLNCERPQARVSLEEAEHSASSSALCRMRKWRLQLPSYPRLVTLHQRNGHVESYCRSLLLAGHGFPIFKPSASLGASKAYPRKGVNIGDVGIIDNYGRFRFYFNIFLPANHDMNKGRTPREFRPLEPALQVDDIRYEKDYFKPGHVVASKGVIVNKHSDHPLDISFTSTEPEGGILILPTGASREDLVSTDGLHEYARKNAPHWYQYVNHYGMTSHANGSLLLVTGYDKANDWALASFPYHSGDTEKKLDLRYTWEPDYRLPWADPGTAEYDFFFPTEQTSNGPQENNQCLFIRGLYLSLTQQAWRRTLPYVEEAKQHYSFILHTPSKLQLWLDSVSVFLRLRLPEQNAVNIVSLRDPHLFHPNYVISQVLAAVYPRAELILLDDNIWCALVDNVELCTMPELNKLVTRILCLYTITEHNGVVFLKPVLHDESKSEKTRASRPFRQMKSAIHWCATHNEDKHVQWVKSVPLYKHVGLFLRPSKDEDEVVNFLGTK